MAEPSRHARNVRAVDQRGPQELGRIGERRKAEISDDGKRDALIAQPCRKRVEDQEIGQPGLKAERQHDKNAPMKEIGDPARL
jgi:hypothetical protein